MSFLPGSEGRRDPERAEAARRQRVRFARDIGDEYGQAWAHEPRRPRRRFTFGTGIVLIAFAVLGAIPLLLHSGDGALVRPDCAAVAVEVAPRKVEPGTSYAWQVAGPESGDYVVAVDATTVTVDAGGRVVPDAGAVLAGPTGLPGCRSRQTVAKAPTGTGDHQVTVFRRSAAGWDRVAVALLAVS